MKLASDQALVRSLFTAILITLISQQALAQAVFYCNGTNLIEIKKDKATNYKTQNFKFSADSKLIKFGDGGYFSGDQMSISDWISEDFWAATNEIAMVRFHKGQFMYAASVLEEDGASGLLISATCDKF